MDNVQAGAVLFTVNLDALATFYERVVDLSRVQSHVDHIILSRGGFRLTVHRIPEHIAAGITISSPPRIRESAAVKLVFAVADIGSARRHAAELGGLVYGEDREWRSGSTLYCDGYDPDGNVFQLIQPI
jgi:predicted enzyme related to lactoylglutathione lyase